MSSMSSIIHLSFTSVSAMLYLPHEEQTFPKLETFFLYGMGVTRLENSRFVIRDKKITAFALSNTQLNFYCKKCLYFFRR